MKPERISPIMRKRESDTSILNVICHACVDIPRFSQFFLLTLLAIMFTAQARAENEEENPTTSNESLLIAHEIYAVGNYLHPNCWLKHMSGFTGPLTGKNPPASEIFEAMRTFSAKYKVPVEIIGAVCYQESGLYQYGADGFVIHNRGECKAFYNGTGGCLPGLGLMQLTGATAKQFDVNLLITDWRYNLEAGVIVLRQKYDYAISLDPPSLQEAEIENWNLLENWRYALAFYNGYKNPENPYVTKVCNIIASPPSGLAGLFENVELAQAQ